MGKVKPTTSQAAAILRDLQRGFEISPIDALNKYGCFRLGARIYDLRKHGHLINRRMEVKSGKRFAVYSMPYQVKEK